MGLSRSPRNRGYDQNEKNMKDLELMLDSVRLDGKITSEKVNQLAAAIQEKLGVDLGADCYKDMAEAMMKMKIEESKGKGLQSSTNGVSQSTEPGLDVPTWSQESSSPEPQVSPNADSRQTLGAAPRSPIAPRSPAPMSRIDGRGRSPSRTRNLNVPRPARSRTPVGGNVFRGRPPTPEQNSIPSRSRSPMPRNRSKSPFQNTRVWSPASRPSRTADSATSFSNVFSPTVFYDAHMHEESVLAGSPGPQEHPKPTEAPQPSGKRPPLVSVAVNPNSTSEISQQHQAQQAHSDIPFQQRATMPSTRGSTEYPSFADVGGVVDKDISRVQESIANMHVDDTQLNIGISRPPAGSAYNASERHPSVQSTSGEQEVNSKTTKGPLENINMEDIKFNIGINKPPPGSSYKSATSPSNRRIRSSHKKTPRPATTPKSAPESSPDSCFSPLDDTPPSRGYPTPGEALQTERAASRGRSSARDDGTAAPASRIPVRSRSKSPFQIFSRWRSPKLDDSPIDPPIINTNATFTSPVASYHQSLFVESEQQPSNQQPNKGSTTTNTSEGGQSLDPSLHTAENTNSKPDPKTPHVAATNTTDEPSPAEPIFNKKGRNTKTPLVVDPTLKFSANLSKGSGATQKNRGKNRRNLAFRRGLASMRADTYSAVPSTASMESPAAATDGCTPTNEDSSEYAPMEIDGNTPPPPSTHPVQPPPDTASAVQFNIGVGGQRSPSNKTRTKRREKGSARRVGQTHHMRSQSVNAPTPSIPTDPPVSQPNAKDQPNHNDEPSCHNVQYGRSHSVNEANLSHSANMKRATVLALREEGKKHYISKNYRASILTYTEAIKQYKEHCMDDTCNDLLAVLLSNRAAGLLMIGACQAVAGDCKCALEYVSDSAASVQSSDWSPALRPKLYNRMAKAFIRLGDLDAAEKSLKEAIHFASIALANLGPLKGSVQYEVSQKGLEQVMEEATLQQTELSTLREITHKVQTEKAQSQLSQSSTRRKLQEALSNVNLALVTATKCESLHTRKVELLAALKHWRELGTHCERLAAENVKLDECFTEDLAPKHPFIGVAPAKFLTSDFFGDTRDDEIRGAELKLNSKSAAEAVLRVPAPLTQFYIRSLRLEERYPAAEAALRSLEQYVRSRSSVYDQGRLRNTFSWLPKEQDLLTRTKSERERGDELFRRGNFSKAAAQYAACLYIDTEGSTDAGGRLHAVIHCNRAACLMAEKKFAEAITECTAALRIHPRYMKALLRRARCFSRLDRLEEACNEFKQWLEYANQAKTNPQATLLVSPCLFDAPHEVSQSEMSQVKAELEEVVKAKARAEAAAQAERRYREQRQRWENEKFHNTKSHSTAQDRRDYFYSQQSSSSRRWDSFADRGPKRSSKPNTKASGSGSGGQKAASPKNLVQEKDHYKVLGVRSNASDADIKKAYRKQALKYHPDKNSDPTAVDLFRRVKQAHEILIDPAARRKYDSENQWRMRF